MGARSIDNIIVAACERYYTNTAIVSITIFNCIKRKLLSTPTHHRHWGCLDDWHWVVRSASYTSGSLPLVVVRYDIGNLHVIVYIKYIELLKKLDSNRSSI